MPPILAKEAIQARLLTPLSCHRFLLNYRLNCRRVETQVNMIVKNHIVASTVDEQLAHETSNICCSYCPYFDNFMYWCPFDTGRVVAIAFPDIVDTIINSKVDARNDCNVACLQSCLLEENFQCTAESEKGRGSIVPFHLITISEKSIFPIQSGIGNLTPYFHAQ
jgi:hypothetical protein